MSGSFYWQPIKGKCLHVGSPSKTLSAFEEAFGGLPLELEDTDIPVLKGLAAAQVEGANDLMDALYKHKSVRLWVEY